MRWPSAVAECSGRVQRPSVGYRVGRLASEGSQACELAWPVSWPPAGVALACAACHVRYFPASCREADASHLSGKSRLISGNLVARRRREQSAPIHS